MTTTAPHNPLRQHREARGLKRSDLAFALGLSMSAITAVELGHARSLPDAWRAGLESLGFDFDTLKAAYANYRGRQLPLLEG